ncbi:MAG: tetratricopeptide repeat protein [Spirochaetia bacterium]
MSISCSTAPKDSQPTREVSKTASEYAVFGNKFYREGRYREAEEMYLYSLQYYRRIDNRVGILNSYNSLGKTYLADDSAEDAERVFKTALRISERIEREGVFPQEELAPLRAEIINNLGETALRRGNNDSALEHFNAGIEILSSKEHEKELAVLLHNRGSVYVRKGSYEKAREDLMSSLKINSSLEAHTERASNYYMLSRLASREGDFTLAKTYGLKALEFDKISENSVGIAQDLIALGHIAAEENKLAESGDYYIRAYRIYDSLNLDSGVEKVVEYLRRVGADSYIAEEEPGVEIDVEEQETMPTIPSE